MITRFKQSKNWGISKDIDWLIENAEFAFTNKHYKGNRVRIVTKEGINGMNCFELDNDRHGIVVISEHAFNTNHDYGIVEKATGVMIVPMIAKFLKDWGAGSFVRMSDMNIPLPLDLIPRRNHKIVTIQQRLSTAK